MLLLVTVADRGPPEAEARAETDVAPGAGVPFSSQER